MIAINLEPELERQLADLARQRGQTVDSVIHRAIERMVEDLRDLTAAEEALRDYDPSTNVSLAELRADLGLDA